VLAAASFFLPQYAAGNGQLWSPFGLCRELGDALPLSEYLYHALWVVSWLIVPLLLLAPGRRGLEGFLLVLLLLASFSLSTFASIHLTEPDARLSGLSTGLGLALFAVPPVLAAIAVARVLGGGDRRVTAGLVRASLGLLLALHALFVAGAWWDFFGTWPGIGGAGRTLVGAWTPLVGGLVIVAGEVRLLLVPPPQGAPAPAAA
jgi:hypothetical protein